MFHARNGIKIHFQNVVTIMYPKYVVCYNKNTPNWRFRKCLMNSLHNNIMRCKKIAEFIISNCVNLQSAHQSSFVCACIIKIKLRPIQQISLEYLFLEYRL